MIYLANQEVIESSGLCRSMLNSTTYYTHNDSGGLPVLYAFNKAGADLGCVRLQGKSLDNEDISSNTVNGRATIILADVGDNNLRRNSYVIRVVTEPVNYTDELIPNSVINFVYQDGRHNCEACALLPDGRILLATKNYPAGPSALYILRSSLSGDSANSIEKLATFNVGTITAMDLSPDGTKMVLLANGKAHIFAYPVVSATPTAIKCVSMPKALQPEGVCFSHCGNFILMSSETNKTAGARTPIYTIPIP